MVLWGYKRVERLPFVVFEFRHESLELLDAVFALGKVIIGKI